MKRYEFNNIKDASEYIYYLLLYNVEVNFRLLKLDNNYIAVDIFDMRREKK